MTTSYGNRGLESPIYCSQDSSNAWIVDQTAEDTLERPENEDAGT